MYELTILYNKLHTFKFHLNFNPTAFQIYIHLLVEKIREVTFILNIIRDTYMIHYPRIIRSYSIMVPVIL
jgi:hypothetical protein